MRLRERIHAMRHRRRRLPLRDRLRRRRRMIELGLEGEKIGRLSMADIVNFQDRLQDRLDKRTEDFARMDLIAKMIPAMVEAVGKFRAMGADSDQIIRFLRATIEEFQESSG